MKEKYHHGNLQVALVDAAIKILETEGIGSLSLRRIARDVGVSQAAPYSHFKDKSELLIAISAAGYKQFNERMRVEAEGSTGPAYIAGLGRGYIYFAIENPALFELMFSGDPRNDPEWQSKRSDPVFNSGYDLLDEGLSKFPIPYFEDDALSRAISWGLVHGVADLLLGQRITPERYGYSDIDEFIHATMEKFVGG